MDLYQIINLIGVLAGIIGIVFSLMWILSDVKRGIINLIINSAILVFNVTIGLTLY